MGVGMNIGLQSSRLLKIAYPVDLREVHGIELMPLEEMRRRGRIRGLQQASLAKIAAKVPAVKPKVRKINRDRRRYLTEQIILILRTGQPTIFAHEADCRNGLRIALCLDGWTWAEAEAAAEGILLTALRYVGAKRPTWIEGQPEHTQEGYAPIERTRCLRCGGNMPDIADMQNGLDRKYCSGNCRNSDRLHYERKSGEKRTMAQYWAALAAAGEVKKLKRERPCKWCGTLFIPRNIVDDIEHCSKSCGSKSAQAPRKVIRPCAACGKSYHCSGPGKGKTYCSKACWDSVNKLSPKPCEWCGTEFLPKSRQRGRFCSRRCSAQWRCASKPANDMPTYFCEAAE